MQLLSFHSYILSLLWLSVTIASGAERWLEIAPDHENGVYVSEQGSSPVATFTLTAQGDTSEGETLGYVFEWNKLAKITQGTVTLKDGVATLPLELLEPGCFILTVSLGKQADRVGVVCDPFEITYTTHEPSDFDAFWKRQLQALADVPMNVRMTPLLDLEEKYSDAVECFDVALDCVGEAGVHGYYARPADAKPRSLPAYISVPGSGMRDSSLWGAYTAACFQNRISLNMNAHGFPNAQSKAFYKEKATELYGYRDWGDADPETLYFKYMVMRYLRGIDFLASQPEWNGEIILSGYSQGGLCILLAGLDPRVTEIIAIEPSYCDRDQRDAIYEYKRGKSRSAVAIKTWEYYDACHFAKRFQGKAQFEIGLIDYAVPAKGVFAAFNELNGEKSIIILPQRNHGGNALARERRKDPQFLHQPAK